MKDMPAKLVAFLLACLASTFSIAQKRLIPHLTNPSGGFESEVILVNASPSPQTYHLDGYDSDGVLQATASGVLAPFQTISGSDVALFGTLLSHIEIVEGAQITVSVRFRSSRDGTGPAHVHESSYQSNSWRIYPGNGLVTWDGLALVNTGNQSGSITVTQISASGEMVAGPKEVVSGIPVMGKRLYLFATDFTPDDQTVFHIQSNVPLAVLALRGNLGSDYIWENQALSDLKDPAPEPEYLMHITSATGGFSSQIIISNPSAESKTYVLRAYDVLGNTLQGVEDVVGPGASLFQDAQTLFGPLVSHVEVLEGDELNFSVAYQRNREATGPAHVHTNTQSSRAWRVFPGDFSVTWDGIAVLNLGTESSNTEIYQINRAGAVVHGPVIAIQDLPVNGKGLYLLAQDFNEFEASTFEVISSQPTMVMALRGNLDSDFLWENRAVPFVLPGNGPVPASRIDYAMVFDEVQRQIIMVGGFDAAFDLLDDTWRWNGRRWSVVTTPDSPMPRAHHAGTFDGANQQTVIFGGFAKPPLKRNDFMAFDGHTWIPFPGDSQIPAEDGELLFDTARNRLILMVPNGASLEMWEHQPQGWTRIETATKPLGVVDQAVGYDPFRQRVIMFGGLAPGNQVINQTWEFDGQNWSQVTPANPPPALMGMAAWFDTRRQQFVIFGGMNQDRELTNETWVYEGSDWHQVTTPSAPSPRWVTFAAFHADRGVATLFGGEANGEGGLELLNDTWEFDGSTWREVNLVPD